MKIAYDILKRHNVTRLCHFTRFVTLKYIFESPDGIKARSFVNGLVSRPTDKNRFDREEDYICCSIEYPNTWYLDKVRNDDPIFKDWAILCIDPLALIENSVKYSVCNAAKGNGAYVCKESEDMEELFAARTMLGYSRPASMLECYPTDGQSEILVHNSIPRRFITGIILKTEAAAKQIVASFKTLEIPEDVIPEIYLSQKLFEKRSWNEYVRNGQRPEEILYRRTR